MIYLSDFITAGKDERAISIAAMRPGIFKGEARKDLAPKFSSMAKYRDCKYAEFASEYTEIVYSHNLDALAKELDGRILLCNCPKDEFCHRLLLGFYLHKETGIEVEEIGGFGEIWKKLAENKDEPMRIFLDERMFPKHDRHGRLVNAMRKTA